MAPGGYYSSILQCEMHTCVDDQSNGSYIGIIVHILGKSWVMGGDSIQAICPCIVIGDPSNQSIVMGFGYNSTAISVYQDKHPTVHHSRSSKKKIRQPAKARRPQSIRPCVSPFSSRASLSPCLPPSLPRYRT